MTNAAHTDLPWIIVAGANPLDKVIYGHYEYIPLTDMQPPDICIATVHANYQTLANANLIAAAPDMLELLEEIQEETCKTWCDEGDKEVPHCEECLKAKAVIAKAKGGAL